MTKTIQVSVTAADIAAARRHSMPPACLNCPIAIVLRRKLPWARVAKTFVWDGNSNDSKIKLPLSARVFIAAFDAGEQVEPLVFELEVSE